MMNEHDYCYAPSTLILSSNTDSIESSLLVNTNANVPTNTIESEPTQESTTTTNQTNADEPCNDSQEKPQDPIIESFESNVTQSSPSKCKRRTFDTKESLLEPIDKNVSPVDEMIGEYYFESDHLALRGNQDYMTLLKTIAVLQVQRTKAIQDLDRLHKAEDEILSNPIAFIEKLQRKEELDLPSPQVFASLPTIDWDRYLISFNPNAFKHRHMTRRKGPEHSRAAAMPLQPVKTEPTSSKSTQQCDDIDSNNLSSYIEKPIGISGRRSRNEIRTQTYNQAWTEEEQKRLEELLIKFPSEEVEAKRWQKIADALGNRTRQQVTSRVQKYFIKLTKAGIQVPGRIPNITNYSKKGYGHRHQRLNRNRLYFQRSTFFPSIEPSVFMNDNDDTMSSYNMSSTSSNEGDNDRSEILSDDETIPVELRETEEYKELIDLQRLRKNKEKTEAGGLAQHVGFKCDRCECDPIMGTRWHCLDCMTIDFCSDCVDCMHETATHKSNHQLQPVATAATSYIDGDYIRFLPGDYNYLDPNYMPAT